MIIYPAGPAVIQDIVAHLQKGEAVAIPTETVYGLVADATNAHAIEKIFTLKARPKDQPLSVLIADAAEMTRWASEIPESAQRLAEKFWPGPLTLVLPKAAHVSSLLTANKPSIGLRVPNHPIALEVLRAFGGGLAAPSANPTGSASACSAAEVARYFSDALWVLDGGAANFGLASTIVDCTGAEPVILREGAISKKAIFQVL